METKGIKSAIPFMSALLLTYGYFYLRIYYIGFGIKVHNFFSIEDYLRASIEYIFILIFPFIVSLYFGMTLAFADSDSAITRRKQNKMDTFASYFLMIGFTSLGLILTFLIENEMKPWRYFLFGIAAMAFWVEFWHRIIPKKFVDFLYKKTNLWIASTILFVFPLTFIHLYWNAKFDFAKVIERKNPNNIEIVFKEEFFKEKWIDQKQLVLIGSNSAYIFLYDKCKKSTYIVPSGSIVIVEVKSN